MKGLGLRAYFRVEDFWKTAIVGIQEELMGLDRESVKKFSYVRRFLFMLFNKLRLYFLFRRRSRERAQGRQWLPDVLLRAF